MPYFDEENYKIHSLANVFVHFFLVLRPLITLSPFLIRNIRGLFCLEYLEKAQNVCVEYKGQHCTFL